MGRKKCLVEDRQNSLTFDKFIVMVIEKIVVDDEMMIRRHSRPNYAAEVFNASTGDLKGSQNLGKGFFDLVFLDLCLPDGDGTDLFGGNHG